MRSLLIRFFSWVLLISPLLSASEADALEFKDCSTEDQQAIAELAQVVGKVLSHRKAIGLQQGADVYPAECRLQQSPQEYSRQYSEYSQIFNKLADYFESDYQVICDYRQNCFSEYEGCRTGSAVGCATLGLPHMTLCMRRLTAPEGTGDSRRFYEGLMKTVLHEMAHSAGYRHTQHREDGRVAPVSFTYQPQKHRAKILQAICEFDNWQRNPDTFGMVGYWLVYKDAKEELLQWQRKYQRPAAEMAPVGH